MTQGTIVGQAQTQLHQHMESARAMQESVPLVISVHNKLQNQNLAPLEPLTTLQVIIINAC